jgi:hypothetical protein
MLLASVAAFSAYVYGQGTSLTEPNMDARGRVRPERNGEDLRAQASRLQLRHPPHYASAVT